MTNHYHLLVTPPDSYSLSAMMQTMGRHFVPFIHNKYGGSGSIWEGRFKASLVQDETYFLNCMRYIEMNPVSANMVALPEDYTWSSFKHNALGDEPYWIDEHTEYLALGSTSKARQVSYQEMFSEYLSKAEIFGIESALQTGTPLGNQRFNLDKSAFKTGHLSASKTEQLNTIIFLYHQLK